MSTAETNWQQIASLYDVLFTLWPTPVVQLNRAMAHGHAAGPTAGLAVLDSVDADALADYPQLAGVRGELLKMAGRDEEAATAYEQAAATTRNEQERTLFTARAADIRSRRSDPGECSVDGP